MSSRSYRAALATLLSCLSAFAVTAPASAAGPDDFLPKPDPLILPAFDPETGEGFCSGFNVQVTWTDFRQFVVRQSFDPTTGITTLQLAGAAKATVTNLDTEETIGPLNISGPGTIVIYPDGSFTVVAAGPNLFWTEQRFSAEGVPFIAYSTGRVTFAVDATGDTTAYTLAGGARQTDVCALLAG